MAFDHTPTKVRFIIAVVISVVLTAVAIVIQYVHITSSGIHGGFEILLVGYLVLLAGSLLRGVLAVALLGSLRRRPRLRAPPLEPLRPDTSSPRARHFSPSSGLSAMAVSR